jgi:mono/diheme cytochrome c family protein
MVGLVVALTLTQPVEGQSAADQLRLYEAAARAEDPNASPPSVSRGEELFQTTHGGDWSCATCHGQQPTAPGQHTVTGKTIAPLAPAANPQRFTRPDKVEKWFRRNCNDVFGRACTADEKRDVLAYLLSLDK